MCSPAVVASKEVSDQPIHAVQHLRCTILVPVPRVPAGHWNSVTEIMAR